MTRQFKVIGTEIKTGKPFQSEWCFMDVEKIEVKGKVVNFPVTLDYIETFAYVVNQMLTDWQFIYREVEV